MMLRELWAELESRAPHERTGRMTRRIYPESAIDLFVSVTLDGAGGQACPSLELQVDRAASGGFDPPTGSRQIEARLDDRAGGRAALVLILRDHGAEELFAAMCEDIARATAAAASDADAIGAWTGRFAKWRRMLQGGGGLLSPERQRGLFAELRTIREQLVTGLGFDEAVLAWTGPEGAARDFEVRGCGIEVKASAANEPQVVPVNGERQLDGTGLDALILVHESLEVLRDAGETLPDLVASLRRLGEDRAHAGTLEDRLIQSGYHDVHAPAYRRTGYMVRRTSMFHVREGFPRITVRDLVDGVGSVRYRLAIDACRDFEVDREFLLDRLGGERR
jgi:hypothetical protein